MTPGVAAVLGGSPDARTTEFGDACKYCLNLSLGVNDSDSLTRCYVVTHVLFETGDEKLRALEQKIYVASGRFIIEAGKGPTGKGPTVEYLISEVAA
jgi:hypothetical protein